MSSHTSTQVHRDCHSAEDRYRARVVMASLVNTHASEICSLFGGVSPAGSQNPVNLDQVHMKGSWATAAIALFLTFYNELATILQCGGHPDCETSVFLHTMQHIAHLLRHTAMLSLWSASAHGIYDTLALLVHGDCLSSPSHSVNANKAALCKLIPPVDMVEVGDHFAKWKKALNVSLCQMSASYLHTMHRLHLEAQHPKAAIDTLLFRELYDLVVNKGDKRLAMVFVSMLPEMMGANDISELLQTLSMHMHKFVNQVIKRTEGAASRKFIRLFFAAAGRCTCHAKCSMYGKVNDIQVLAVCKTCRNSPVLRQAREPRCRRTISSTSFMNTCTVDGNTSFIYIPLYRACVNKNNGQLIYEHWAYTLSMNLLGSRKASIYMLCAGGRRTCTNVFFSDSLTQTQCERCQQSSRLEDTCLTAKVGNRLTALCDGCIIAACCPLHAPLREAKRDVWLSILEYFATIKQNT